MNCPARERLYETGVLFVDAEDGVTKSLIVGQHGNCGFGIAPCPAPLRETRAPSAASASAFRACDCKP
jgi:hypothetical protein